MRKQEPVAAQAVRLFSNVAELQERLEATPPESLTAGIWPVRPALEGLETLRSKPRVTEELVDGASDSELQGLIDAGRKALRKVKKEGADAKLERREEVGLEAIIQLTGRPAILIQEGRFFPPPVEWRELEAIRDLIEATFPSIGRIEVTGHPVMDWIGTGFLVADDVIMTNRHVAKEFSRQSGNKKWGFEPGMRVHIDYIEEIGATKSAEFKITEILGIHEDLDLALLRVSRKGKKGVKAPKPLPLASSRPLRKGNKVYVVGYPASDSRRNDPEVMRRIFSGIYNVKRLQPGEITTLPPKLSMLTHDSSTLGGNSGSCVIDLDTHQVVGLHFGGRYRQTNYAVYLPKLVRDPLLKAGKLNFI